MGFLVCELEMLSGHGYVTRTPAFPTFASAWCYALYCRHRHGARVWIERDGARAA